MLPGNQLVVLSLVHVPDAEAGGPVRDDLRGASGDERQIHPDGLDCLEAQPVRGGKRLELVALVVEQELAVGQDAIHVQGQQADARRPFQ